MISMDPKRVRIAMVMINAVMTKVFLIVVGFYIGRKIDMKYGTNPYGVTGGLITGLSLGLWWIIFVAKRFKLY